MADLIDQSIIEEPPIAVTEGGVIKDGYNDQLDQYRDAMNNGKQWIVDLQEHERKLTGINNTKLVIIMYLAIILRLQKLILISFLKIAMSVNKH